MRPPRGRGGGGGFRGRGDGGRGRGRGGSDMKSRGGGRGRGRRGGGMKGGSNVVVEPHRHEGVFVAKGKEDALVIWLLGVFCSYTCSLLLSRLW
ncbi:hypothetical protein V6N13_108838 [Hibiscus sabdariffa]|uniref:Uncharacterized protein n=1 Tax=Hibiscus sabdariffa TaxID=183260 RepID=A0ABR2FNM3_9ROSI